MKNIYKLLILTIILIIISTIIILLCGKTYTISFNTTNNNPNIVIENDPGEIQILNKKYIDNKYIIKVKSKRPGRVFISLKENDYSETKLLYVHKSMIITDNNYFGKSTGSIIIPISLIILLIYSLYLLIKRYRSSIKENLYQYKNISYLGIIIFLSFFTLSIILSLYNYQGLYNTITDIINSSHIVSLFLFPIAFITFVFVTISNIKLLIKEGLSIRNILGVLLGIIICIFTLLPDFIYKLLMNTQIIDIYNQNGPGPYIYNLFETLLYLFIAYLECILIGTIIIALKAVKKKVEYDKDYIIILGCKVRKDGSLTPLLKGRVDKALDFRKEQLDNTGKDLVFIPSGGKGKDEVIEESIAIKNYLKDQGIKEKNVLVEDKSTNTYENIKYSNKLIKKNKANICFSTTNYHVLRAGLIATEQGLKIDGIGSKTKIYFWINAFIREFIGTLYNEKKKHILVFGILLVVIIVMVTITYIANNI